MTLKNMATVTLLLSCLVIVVNSLPFRVYDSPMKKSSYHGYDHYIPRLYDREYRSRYPAVEGSYRDTYRAMNDDEVGNGVFGSDMSNYRPQTLNDQYMDPEESELYSALEDWIIEKESEERREEERENDLRSFYQQQPSDQDGWMEDELSDPDTSSYYYKLLEKIFNRNKEPVNIDKIDQSQIQMRLRDLSASDQPIENEDKRAGENIAVIEEKKKITQRPVLTVEKAKSLLEQLKKAEAEKMEQHHDVEKIDKKSLNNLLGGVKDDLKSEENMKREQTITGESGEVVSTTPVAESVEDEDSGDTDLRSEEDNSNINTDKMMLVRYQLMKEENELLIEALDKLSRYPFEYYQSQAETNRIREILQQASLRQDTISYINEKTNEK